MDEIITAHVAYPVAMRTDNFYYFFVARQEALLDRIEKATGKLINRDSTLLAAQERDESADIPEAIEAVMLVS
jgi:hypothetical protein